MVRACPVPFYMVAHFVKSRFDITLTRRVGTELASSSSPLSDVVMHSLSIDRLLRYLWDVWGGISDRISLICPQTNKLCFRTNGLV